MVNSEQRGFTLLELIISLGILSLLTLAAAAFLIDGLRFNRTLWGGLAAQSDARRIMDETARDIRGAEQSSTGGYPVESAKEYEMVVYANADADPLIERIRYVIVGRDMKRGITNPTGNPLQYVTSSESLVTLGRNIINASSSIPLFSYFDENYTGTEPSLPSPVTTTLVRLVRMHLLVEPDATTTPPLVFERMVRVRNL